MTHSTRLESLTRWRAGLAIASVVLPLALFAVLERQARRLDALAAEGSPVEAHVTGISRDRRTTYYAYRVSGVEYTWSVAREEAAHATGESFTATYLPSDPSLSRPFAERSLAAAESARNRSFAWKVVLGLALFLGFFAFVAHRDLRRLGVGAPSELSDPAAYRRRLAVTGLILVPVLIAVTGFHLQDALEKGESIVPVVVGLALVLGIVGGVFFVVARKGPSEARERASKLMRWLAPIAVGAGLLRLLALALGL